MEQTPCVFFCVSVFCFAAFWFTSISLFRRLFWSFVFQFAFSIFLRKFFPYFFTESVLWYIRRAIVVTETDGDMAEGGIVWNAQHI